MRNPSQASEVPIRKNPHFNRVDRAPYELGYLLRQLPPEHDPFFKLTPETVLIAEAAAQHASNANDTLLHGLAALGQFIYVAGTTEETEVGQDALADLGCLVRHLAVEMQFLQETESTLRHALREHQAQPGKGGK